MSSTDNGNPRDERRAAVEQLAARLAQMLASADAAERRALEAAFAAAVQRALAPAIPADDARFQSLKSPPLTPELRAWLDQQHTDEERVAWIQQLKTQGGVAFSEFLPELEEIVGQS